MEELKQALPLLQKAWLEMSGDSFRPDLGFFINRIREYISGEIPANIEDYIRAKKEFESA